MIGCVAVILTAGILALANAQSAKVYCYADEENPYLNFGTKSNYHHHHSPTKIEYPPGCKPVYFWLVSRHGTRWAEAQDMGEFTDLFNIRDKIKINWLEGRGDLCRKDIINLMDWKFDMVHEQGYTLTEQGRDDLFYLGRRFRSNFPELLETSFDPHKFVVRHTNTARTKESAEYFYKGVFGLEYESPEPVLHGAMSTEHLIYPYKNCPKFDALGGQVKKERAKFEKSDLMKALVVRVSKRLGFEYNLTYGNIKSMFDGCRYQKAWFVHEVSPWCTAFLFEDLEILEYNEDIRYYYKSGPGTPMNIRLGCPIVKDLVERFRAYENYPNAQPQGVFYFSHVTMIDMLSARLGLIEQPEHLMAADFEMQRNRKFRTSNIIPFTGNVAAVLYKCEDGLNVVFYQSEGKVMYKGCPDGVCSLQKIKDMFKFTRDRACTDTSYCFEDDPGKTAGGKLASRAPKTGLSAGHLVLASVVATAFHSINYS